MNEHLSKSWINLKVLLPRKFRYLFYCFIEIFKCLRVFRCKDEQYSSTRSGRIFRLKWGFTSEILRRHVLGLWRHKYDTTSDHNKKTRSEQAKVGKYFVFFSTFLVIVFYDIAKLTYLKALGIESDYDIPNNSRKHRDFACGRSKMRTSK